MARRKKSTSSFPPIVGKILLIGIVVIFVGGICFKVSNHLLINAQRFSVKVIIIDPTLSFINKRDFEKIKGQSIFTVDLKSIQKRISRKYPQVSQLKITKRFPDQILVTARERIPFAQTRLRNRVLTIDQRGILLSTTTRQDKNFPFISGAKAYTKRFSLGLPLRGKEIFSALKILRAFELNRKGKGSMLNAYSIERIDVTNLSEITLLLSKKLKIIIDRDQIAKKFKVLGVVLSQGKLDLKNVRYIDLRFKEPVIGKK